MVGFSSKTNVASIGKLCTGYRKTESVLLGSTSLLNSVEEYLVP